MASDQYGITETPATATKRARELYKYFTPPRDTDSTAKRMSSTDTVLGAHTQLVAWRLNKRRAMVSLIDRETQYFVAEGTQTMSLEDSSQYEDPRDALWAGCVSVSKAGRLCEYTVEAPTPPAGEGTAYFEVLDLQNDCRFNTLQFVEGPPYFRYYVGVPLRTKNGVNIGSIFALDDKVNEPITPSHIAFLATMANNCMSHLESIKEKTDMKRVRIMNMSLAAFVDPENSARPRKKRRKPRLPDGSDVDRHSQLSRDSKLEYPVSPGVKSTTSQGSLEEKDYPANDDAHLDTFKVATTLLFESLGIGPSSGILFIDAGTSVITGDDPSDDEIPSGDRERRRESGKNATQVSYRSSQWGRSWSTPHEEGITPDIPPSNPSEVVASSKEAVDGEPPSSPDFNFVPLSQLELAKMIKKYPRGMLCSLEDEEIIASGSSGDEQGKPYRLPKLRNTVPTDAEISVLKSQFPDGRQLIFVPIWNPAWSRFSALIAVNADPYRSFQNSPDFLHCIAFSHCITTELTRIVTTNADQQKSDFIGSISHELRSPLHGILASCEFLDDTELSTDQKTLVDTADSCARTLLDTINMVLDYSKINAFERNTTKASRNRRYMLSTSHLQPSLNIYGNVDLSEITESVIEGVATGQAYKDRLADVDTTDLPETPRSFESPRGTDSVTGLSYVEIIIDMPPGDWVFLTQPGAFRRVVMNVFGNSLKYTRRGYIRVRLETNTTPKGPTETEAIHIVTLTITDTGQGISAQYMKTKLFTPFAQESSIAPGTGLGLSLVQNIVRMLNGQIDIKSTVGVGTEVVIKFPMIRTPASERHSESTPSSSGSIERTKDDSLKIVRHRGKGCTTVYFRPNLEATTESAKLMRDVVCSYLTDWYGFKLDSSLEKTAPPDIVIVGQSDFTTLLGVLHGLVTTPQRPMVLVICTNPSKWKFDRSESPTMKNVESISYPFGPYKLARIIRICLDKLDRAAVAESPFENIPTSPIETTGDKITQVIQSVDQLNLGPDVRVIQQGSMMANAEFAPLMVEAQSSQTTRSIEQASGFPFPPSEGASPAQDDTVSSVPTMPSPSPMEATRDTPPTPGTPSIFSSSVPRTSLSRNPRFLLVDDNKVNLRLLQAFMRKRGYTDLHLADDGAIAVQCYKAMIEASTPHPPDIIFMDISMPVMNGFEATRQIRLLEAGLRASLPPMQTPPSSMIIALTGLGSSRDQSEAFTSGFDIYLVKPISFKSVAKLLDSWERNGGAGNTGVPHGSLSEESIKPV